MSEVTVKDKISSARTELNNNNSNLTVSSQRNVECASSGSSTNSDMSDGDNAFLEGDEPKVVDEDICEPLLKITNNRIQEFIVATTVVNLGLKLTEHGATGPNSF
ncbi:hypothetical protein FQR65_LT06268 [Abscondita terminalis]|nr:hypothetical protein FQR65_LT06268 [Abscondita terminalis]